ncbi:MAG: hypothetical protein ABI639_05590 [Thermoanaerobaculia bacterium]
MKRALVLLLGLIVLVESSKASDIEYGASGLAGLSSRADLVVRAISLQKVPSASSRFSTYSVSVGAVLRGVVDPDQPLLVRVPAGLDFLSASLVHDSLLFLDTDPNDAGFMEVSVGGVRTSLLIAGRLGAVDVSSSSPPNRESKIKTFLSIAGLPERLSWARDAIGSDDEYLERSALFDFASPGAVGGDVVVKILKDAIDRQQVAAGNLSVVVDALRNSGSPEALEVLGDLVDDAKAQMFVKNSAIEAMPALPGGLEMLKGISLGNGQLKDRARLQLDQMQDEASLVFAMKDADRLIPLLDSPDVKLRDDALGKLIAGEPSSDLVAAYRRLLQRDSWAGTTVKLLIVEDLSTFDGALAATLLKDVAADSDQSDLVRRRAIINIGKFESAISKPILTRLATKLEDAKLRNLAKASVNQ